MIQSLGDQILILTLKVIQIDDGDISGDIQCLHIKLDSFALNNDWYMIATRANL